MLLNFYLSLHLWERQEIVLMLTLTLVVYSCRQRLQVFFFNGSVLFRCLVFCVGRRDSSLWSSSISTHRPWWMCSLGSSAVLSRPLFGLKLSLYDTNGHTHSCFWTFRTNIFLCYNVMFFFSKQWLNDEKLAQRLIELIHPERDDEVGRFSILFEISDSCLSLKIDCRR